MKASNEFGILLDLRRRPQFAARAFKDACDLGFGPGCAKLDPCMSSLPRRMSPTIADCPVVLQGAKGPMLALTPLEPYQLACMYGFWDGYQKAGISAGTMRAR